MIYKIELSANERIKENISVKKYICILSECDTLRDALMIAEFSKKVCFNEERFSRKESSIIKI
jgi:hypothetical protein